MRRDKSNKRSATILALSLGVASGVTLAPSLAEASVEGKQGLEIEGPRDRRGFMGGFGAGFGGTYISNGFVPAPRFEGVLGGGITRRLTLGADLFFAKYLSRDEGWSLGGDFEVTWFVVRDFFIRGGGGVHAVPLTRGDKDPTYGVGGKGGIGYEFFINNSAALALSVEYDYRYAGVDPVSVHRHGAFGMVTFMFY